MRVVGIPGCGGFADSARRVDDSCRKEYHLDWSKVSEILQSVIIVLLEVVNVSK